MSKRLMLKDIKVGDKLKMTTDKYVNSGFPIKTEVTVYQKQSNYIYVRNSVGQQVATLLEDLTRVILTREDLNKDIQELEAEIASHKDKLEWMELTGNEEYDETEVKVWKTLKTLNSKSTDAEKAKVIAKVIAKLING